jgi:hypothetical protein
VRSTKELTVPQGSEPDGVVRLKDYGISMATEGDVIQYKSSDVPPPTGTHLDVYRRTIKRNDSEVLAYVGEVEVVTHKGSMVTAEVVATDEDIEDGDWVKLGQ